MVKTRSIQRTRKQAYRARVKTSACRGKTAFTCRLRNGCKRTHNGKRKSYCRKKSNKRL